VKKATQADTAGQKPRILRVRSVRDKVKESLAKTLYVADMDGTLLGASGKLSDFAVEALNGLIAQGMHFTVATARSAASAPRIMRKVRLRLPMVLMNGVMLFDPVGKTYVHRELLAPNTVKQVLAALKACNQTAFMYAVQDEKMTLYYESLDDGAMQEFYDERVRTYGKRFIHTPQFSRLDFSQLGDVIYFILMGPRRRMEPLLERIKEISGLSHVLYPDVYNLDYWYLEMFSDRASKRSGVDFLRQHCGFERVVGFGDNLPDLSLFEACDESYAVENALEELKACATGIIESNEQDGVCLFLKQVAQGR